MSKAKMSKAKVSKAKLHPITAYFSGVKSGADELRRV
jgi:hypothetical protein